MNSASEAVPAGRKQKKSGSLICRFFLCLVDESAGIARLTALKSLAVQYDAFNQSVDNKGVVHPALEVSCEHRVLADLAASQHDY